jgi:hypothetical protein
MPPSVFTNFPTVKVADSVNVVLFDSLNTQQQDQTYVRDQLIKYVNDFPSGRQLAIFVLGSQLRLICGFTTDFSGLSIALDDSDKGARFLRQAFSWTLLTTWLARSTRGKNYSREPAARRFRHSGDPVKNNHSSVPEIVVNHPPAKWDYQPTVSDAVIPQTLSPGENQYETFAQKFSSTDSPFVLFPTIGLDSSLFMSRLRGRAVQNVPDA